MAISITSLVYIDSTGYHYADYPTFLAYFTEQYKGIYGPDVYLGSDSQDGQWLAVQAQAAYDSAALGAMTYASFSPVSAQGTGLSRVVKINGLERDNPTYSTVNVDLGGTQGTVITNGVVTDNLSQKWNLPASVTIPPSGTITVTATAAEQGAIDSTTIADIFTPTRGWQTVAKSGAVTVGAPVETDGTLRQRQKVSTALPAQTVFEATVGAVANVTGVTASRGYENYTNAVDGNGLPPHSIAIVAKGGTDIAVATAIQVKKTPGTDTFGTTAVPLVDSKGMPITINFYRPTNAQIGVRVTIAELDGWTNDYLPLIQNAVAAAVLAMPIGGTIVLTKLFLVAYLPGTVAFGTFDITTIELQKNGGGFGTANIQLLFNEIPTCAPLTDVVIVP